MASDGCRPQDRRVGRVRSTRYGAWSLPRQHLRRGLLRDVTSGDTVLPVPCPVFRSHVSSDSQTRVGFWGAGARRPTQQDTLGPATPTRRPVSLLKGRPPFSPSCPVPRRGRGPKRPAFLCAASLLPETRQLSAGPCQGPRQPSGRRGGTAAPTHCHPESPSFRLTVSIFLASRLA